MPVFWLLHYRIRVLSPLSSDLLTGAWGLPTKGTSSLATSLCPAAHYGSTVLTSI